MDFVQRTHKRWTTTHGHTSNSQAVKTLIHWLCVNFGCHLENLSSAMADRELMVRVCEREKERDRVRERKNLKNLCCWLVLMIYIYIYIWNFVVGPKRERNILKCLGPRRNFYFFGFMNPGKKTNLFVDLHILIYIYIYIKRERERERDCSIWVELGLRRHSVICHMTV